MKNIIATAFLICAAIITSHAQTILLEEGFENGIPTEWNNLDHDGDGFSWETLSTDEDEVIAHTGNFCVTSASYDSEQGEPLTPDNYLITPAIEIPSTLTLNNMPILSWWAAAQDSEYPADYYEVRVSTTGNSISDFTENAIYAEILSTDEWAQHTVNLSGYIGQTIYIAFIHTNCSDEFIMKLDDISVYYFDEPSIAVTPNTLDFGTLAINTPRVQQVSIISALLDGPITATCSAPYSVSINNNTFSTSQSLTANTTATLFVKYEPTEAGNNAGTITLTSGEQTTTITVNGTGVNCETTVQLPFSENFEQEISPCWTLRDVDQDGSNWMWADDGYGHESDGYYISYSYDEEEWEDITPNDWLITPRIAIPTTGAHMSWWAAGYSEDFPNNSYDLLIANNLEFSDADTLYSETMQSDVFGQRFADLSEYAGQEVYIAFIHNTNTAVIESGYALVIDDVLIEEGIGIEENTTSQSLSVYPNPASQILNVKADGFDQCTIVNAFGQTVSTEPIVNGELHLNISSLANGIYFVKCSGNESVKTVKFIKK